MSGVVYLLHLDRPLAHAKHYNSGSPTLTRGSPSTLAATVPGC